MSRFIGNKKQVRRKNMHVMSDIKLHMLVHFL